jgi:hypothetical protein
VDGRTGSITVTALVGTGLTTLVVALTGVAGLSGDLQAAAAKGTTPVPSLTPGEELHDTQHTALVLRDACARLHHHHGEGATTPSPSTSGTTPAATTPAKAY